LRSFDAVMCVGPAHHATAALAVRALALHARPRRIVVFTAGGAFRRLEPLRAEGIPLVLVDEDAAIPGVSLSALRARLAERGGDPARAGWYLQQFLKMAACELPEIPERYLVWDADTILLRPTEFFTADGHALVNPATEHHAPYFETCRALLGIERRAGYSFIAESLPVKTAHMRRLLDAVRARAPGRPWALAIVDAIDPRELSLSGFSEFETYGNFVLSFDPDHVVVRPLRTCRDGAARYGAVPGRNDLELLALEYAWVSFEAWTPRRPARVALAKTRSALVHVLLHPRTPWGRAWRRRRLRP
jgi:hypothetical protein